MHAPNQTRFTTECELIDRHDEAGIEFRLQVGFTFKNDGGSLEDFSVTELKRVTLYYDRIGGDWGYDIDVTHETHGDTDWLSLAQRLLKVESDAGGWQFERICQRAIDRAE